MIKKVFVPLLMGILISVGSLSFAQETIPNAISPKIKQSRLSIQWSFDAETTKNALEINNTYLAKVQEIAKKYKIELKEISNSFSIEAIEKDEEASKENSKELKNKIRMYYAISTSFESNPLLTNTMISDLDSLNYVSLAYDEYDGCRE